MATDAHLEFEMERWALIHNNEHKTYKNIHDDKYNYNYGGLSIRLHPCHTSIRVREAVSQYP